MGRLAIFNSLEEVIEELIHKLDENSIETITIIITEKGGGIRVLANSERTMHQRVGRSVSDDTLSGDGSEKCNGLEHVDDEEYAEDIGHFKRKFSRIRLLKARKPGI